MRDPWAMSPASSSPSSPNYSAGEHLGARRSAPVAARARHVVTAPALTCSTSSFLPQFVHVDRGSVPAQVLVLGLLFVARGIMSDSTYALVASTLGRWLRRSQRVARAEPIVSGSVYVGLGLTAAMSGGHAAARSG